MLCHGDTLLPAWGTLVALGTVTSVLKTHEANFESGQPGTTVIRAGEGGCRCSAHPETSWESLAPGWDTSASPEVGGHLSLHPREGTVQGKRIQPHHLGLTGMHRVTTCHVTVAL